MALKAVVLPAPFGPISASDLAFAHREAHVGDRGQPAEVHREFSIEERSQRSSGCASARSASAGAPLPAGSRSNVAPRARCPAAGSRPPAPSARRRRSIAPRARSRGAQDLRQEAEDQPADHRPGERALAAGDHHDHHRHGVDEQEDVRVDDARCSARRGARPRRPSPPTPPPPAPGSASRRCRPSSRAARSRASATMARPTRELHQPADDDVAGDQPTPSTSQ